MRNAAGRAAKRHAQAGADAAYDTFGELGYFKLVSVVEKPQLAGVLWTDLRQDI
jgi:hypothetical protein